MNYARLRRRLDRDYLEMAGGARTAPAAPRTSAAARAELRRNMIAAAARRLEFARLPKKERTGRRDAGAGEKAA